MKKAKTAGSRKDLIVILVIIAVIIVLAERSYLKPGKVVTPQKNTEVIFPYRAINVGNDSSQLIAYEFHQRNGDGAMRYQACCAIIKNTDPQKDDYKTYCKSIIEDIIKSVGNDKLDISIYDDYEAYELAEVKRDQQFGVLNDTEVSFVDKHTVAYYCGNKFSNNEGNHTLWFYPDAHDRYTQKEIYEP